MISKFSSLLTTAVLTGLFAHSVAQAEGTATATPEGDGAKVVDGENKCKMHKGKCKEMGKDAKAKTKDKKHDGKCGNCGQKKDGAKDEAKDEAKEGAKEEPKAH